MIGSTEHVDLTNQLHTITEIPTVNPHYVSFLVHEPFAFIANFWWTFIIVHGLLSSRARVVIRKPAVMFPLSVRVMLLVRCSIKNCRVGSLLDRKWFDSFVVFGSVLSRWSVYGIVYVMRTVPSLGRSYLNMHILYLQTESAHNNLQ